KYFTYNEDVNQNSSSKENSYESFSDSSTSLRRRLFAEDEGFSTPIKNFRATKIWTTPIRMQNAHGTPASDVLSSSPITPPNCSDSCNVLTSPPISPIKANISATDGKIITSNNDEETESSSDSPVEHRGESFMSFCVESQDTNPFPSYVSERQDTGYATGSINSFGNMTSETNYGFVSRITPVTELMEECELSNSASCDISYKMDCASMEGVTSVDCRTGILSNTCNLKTYPWVPTCCSTPAQCTHSQPMTD
ncbi:protein aurora borealis, partial [Caerostris extrusa]